ncbi:hypothetical protein C8F01DRAFT_1136390 [Mycena amicta]|nr:hypothetical protein C8F01DRAFT_1136390 [Mycena amicta]
MKSSLGKALAGCGRSAGYTLATILCFPFLLYSSCTGYSLVGHFGHRCGEPKPLPSRRIDVRSKKHAAQPNTCSFLHKLPLELRRCVYEEALGGRRILLFISNESDDSGRRRIRARTTSMLLGREDIVSLVLRLPGQYHPIAIALLRGCRQIYAEAHEILLQSNVFDVFPDELDPIVRCGLGTNIALPHIRSLRVHYWYNFYLPGSHGVFCPITTADSEYPQTTRMFKHIAAMPALTNLTFYFVRLHEPDFPEEVEYKPEEMLDSPWARRLLGTIRNPKLQKVAMNFSFLYRENAEGAQWKDLERTVNEMMVGDGAEERYRQFLRDSDK